MKILFWNCIIVNLFLVWYYNTYVLVRFELNGGFKSSYKKVLFCENINIYLKKIIIVKGIIVV